MIFEDFPDLASVLLWMASAYILDADEASA